MFHFEGSSHVDYKRVHCTRWSSVSSIIRLTFSRYVNALGFSVVEILLF